MKFLFQMERTTIYISLIRYFSFCFSEFGRYYGLKNPRSSRVEIIRTSSTLDHVWLNRSCKMINNIGKKPSLRVQEHEENRVFQLYTLFYVLIRQDCVLKNNVNCPNESRKATRSQFSMDIIILSFRMHNNGLNFQ